MRSNILLLLVISFHSFSQNLFHSERINLGHGFQLVGNYSDDFVYNKISVFRDGIFIFSDNTHEFVRDKISFQKVYSFKNNTFAILIERLEAPNKNLLYCYKIEYNKLQKKDILPLFIALPKNLDSDSNLEVAGFWDYFQMENDSTISYEPIIFYEFTNYGIQLDKTLTINKNKSIYSKFYGYEINENLDFPSPKISKKLKLEISRIKKK
jgi:hypothetical protein